MFVVAGGVCLLGMWGSWVCFGGLFPRSLAYGVSGGLCFLRVSFLMI
jgi:hypothetical protein